MKRTLPHTAVDSPVNGTPQTEASQVVLEMAVVSVQWAALVRPEGQDLGNGFGRTSRAHARAEDKVE